MFLSHECLPASFIGIQASGLHDTSFQYNMKCYVNIREELHANVVFPSGTTMFQRIVERTARKLTALASTTMRIIVGLLRQRKDLMWIAAKFEVICPSEVQVFVHVTADAYNRNELLEMKVCIIPTSTAAHFLELVG